MKAYKVFNNDWTCRGFKYEVGKTYTHKGYIELCSSGFHACKRAVDCFSYYSFDTENKVAEVELCGNVLGIDGDKQCTDKIKIVREIAWEELLTIVNTGKADTGHSNTGNCNTGNMNTGHRNTGDSNTGDSNTGHCNTGYRNTGNWNTGNWNTGNMNTGNCNTGNMNTGHRNTGDSNTGDRNTGDWNTGNCNTGFLNTTDPKTVRIFNKNTNTPIQNIVFPEFFYFDTTQWVSHDTATESEREEHKEEIECMGGFLKEIPYKEAFKRSYANASDGDKKKLKALPNFNKKVFFEISGIEVE